MADNYVTIKSVMSNILEHPLLQDLSIESVINSAVEFMRIVGVPESFTEKVETIEIDNYRALLPCDYYKVIQIRYKGVPLNYTTDTFALSNKHSINDNPNTGTYKIQGGIIFTSIEKGDIELSYMAIAIDEDGFPMIPDDSSYIKALELYIKKKYFTILFDQGKISLQSLQLVQQDYAWYVGQAKASLMIPTIDQMESLTRMWNTLIPKVREHYKSFKK